MGSRNHSLTRFIAVLFVTAAIFAPTAVRADWKPRVVASTLTGSEDFQGFRWDDVVVQDDGTVVFSASEGQDFAADGTVYRADPSGSLQELMREGALSPGFAYTYEGTWPFQLDGDAAGRVYAFAHLQDANNFQGFGSFEIDADGVHQRTVWTDPLRGGGRLTALSDRLPAFNAGGALSFAGVQLADGTEGSAICVSSAADDSVDVLVVESRPAPGVPNSVILSIDLATARNGLGQNTFSVFGRYVGTNRYFRALYRHSVSDGFEVLDLEDGDFVDNPLKIDALSINRLGQVLMTGSRMDPPPAPKDVGVFLYGLQPGPPTVIARLGDLAPVTIAEFQGIQGAAIRDDGSVVLLALINRLVPGPTPNENALYLWRPGSFDPLVRTGFPLPGGGTVGSPVGIGGVLVNDAGDIAWTAELEGSGDVGLWVGNEADGFARVLLTGDSIDITPTLSRTVTQINMRGSAFSFVSISPAVVTPSEDGFPGSMNENGAFAVEVSHSDQFGQTTLIVFEQQPPVPPDPVTFVVNSVSDASDKNPGDGFCDTGNLVMGMPECTLRAAIEESNALAGGNEIAFDIPGPDPWIVTPESELPAIEDPCVVDGRSQPGYVDAPVVVVDGSSPSEPGRGLRVGATSTAIRGLEVRGFAQHGIEIAGADDVTLSDNRIAGNGGDGIRVVSGTGSVFERNLVHDNLGLGIDLVGGAEDAYGVTANDPQDADGGANALQNHPVVVSASIEAGTVQITGEASGPPDTNLHIELFGSEACDASGYGEGQWFLGSTDVVTDATGAADFAASILLPPGKTAAARHVTATATSMDGTSEYGPCFDVSGVPVVSFRALQTQQGVELTWSAYGLGEVSVVRRIGGQSAWTTLATLPGGSAMRYVDERITPGARHDYLLRFLASDGTQQSVGPVSVEVSAADPVVRLRPSSNPMRAEGAFAFRLPQGDQVRLELYSIDGRRVRTLFSGHASAGDHRAEWDGRDAAGRPIAAGNYFAVLTTSRVRKSAKVLVLR